jgi:hypothetical protein
MNGGGLGDLKDDEDIFSKYAFTYEDEDDEETSV